MLSNWLLVSATQHQNSALYLISLEDVSNARCTRLECRE